MPIKNLSQALKGIVNSVSQGTYSISGEGVTSIPKIKPSSSPGEISVDVNFRFCNDICSFQILVPKRIYEGAQRTCKRIRVPLGVSEASVEKDFYLSLLADENQKVVIDSLISKFREYKSKWNLTNDEYAELLVAFVQNIPYDLQKCKCGYLTPRFVVETLVDNRGICSDKSLLLACLLSEEGYSVSLLEFKQDHHMSVGIPVRKGYDYKNTGFANIETTCVSYIGDDTSRFSSQISQTKISKESVPSIISVRKDGMSYTKISEIKIILDMEKEVCDILQKLKSKIDEFGTTKYDGAIISEYNTYVHLYQCMTQNRGNRRLVIKEIEKICV